MVAHETAGGAWSPLRIVIFRWLWIAGTVSNIGTFMHTVGAAWLMTELTRSPTLISLLQTVWAAPGFLLALPAGALADVLDRRKLLLASQGSMLVVATTLGALTLTDRVTTTSLLVLTFVLSCIATVNMPAWTAITPEVVPPDELPQAVALNSVGSNLAQSLGPAAAGIIIAAAGPGAVFLVNAASFVGVVTVVGSWRRVAPQRTMPAEHVGAAILTGLRYTRASRPLLTLLGRIAVFVAFSAALMALLPVLARTRLGVTAGEFGLLEASLGVGAVVTAAVLPRIRRRVGPDGLLLAAGLVFSGGLAVVARSRSLPLSCGGLAVIGGASISVLATVFATVQQVLPEWILGRGLAVAMLTVWLVTSPVAYGWGALATSVGVSTALTVAAIGSAVAVLLAAYPLRIGPILGPQEPIVVADGNP